MIRKIYKLTFHVLAMLMIIIGVVLFIAPTYYSKHLTLWQRVNRMPAPIFIVVTVILPAAYLIREHSEIKKKKV